MKKFFKKVISATSNASASIKTTLAASSSIQDAMKKSTMTSDYLHYRITSRHGLPNNCSAIAWDPIQSLLAVGTTTGSITIFGKPAIEYSLTNTDDNNNSGNEEDEEEEGKEEGKIIRFLQFVINQGLLVSVSDHAISLWDINQWKLVGTLSVKATVTCVHLPFKSVFLYIGQDDGVMQVVNLETLTFTPYLVTRDQFFDHLYVENEYKSSSLLPDNNNNSNNNPWLRIVSISSHPLDNTKILVGHRNGSLIMWDIVKRNITTRFGSSTPPIGLSALSWHKSGLQFAAGYESGNICVFSVGSVNNYKIEEVSPSLDLLPVRSNVKRFPVLKLIWMGDTALFAIGGTLNPDEPESCVISIQTNTNSSNNSNNSNSNSNSNNNNNNNNNVVGKYQWVHLSQAKELLLLFTSPWPESYDDASALIVITEDGSLCFYRIANGGFPGVYLPAAYQLQESHITCIRYYSECPSELIRDLREVMFDAEKQRLTSLREQFPMKGGEFAPNFKNDFPGIIVTGHQDGWVRFWDASSVYLFLITAIDVKKIVSEGTSISCLNFSVDARVLVVGFETGESYIFNFRKSGGDTKGFYCASGSHSGRNAVVHLELQTGLKRLAIVDATGQVSINDLEDGRCKCITRCSFGSPIVSLITCDSSATGHSTGDVLLLGLEKGTVVAVDFITGAEFNPLDSTTTSPVQAATSTIIENINSPNLGLKKKSFPIVPEHLTPVVSIIVVDNNAIPIHIPQGIWVDKIDAPIDVSNHDNVGNIGNNNSNNNNNNNLNDNDKLKDDVDAILSTINDDLEDVESSTRTFYQQMDQKQQPQPQQQQVPAQDQEQQQEQQEGEDKKVATEEEEKEKVKEKGKEDEDKNKESAAAVAAAVAAASSGRDTGDVKEDEDEDEDIVITTGRDEDEGKIIEQRFIIVVTSSFIRIYALPQHERVAKISIKYTAISAEVLLFGDQAALLVFDPNNNMYFYNLLDLRLIANNNLVLKLTSQATKQKNFNRFVAVSRDGRIVAAPSSPTNFFRASLFKNEDCFASEECKPILFRKGVNIPQRPCIQLQQQIQQQKQEEEATTSGYLRSFFGISPSTPTVAAPSFVTVDLRSSLEAAVAVSGGGSSSSKSNRELLLGNSNSNSNSNSNVEQQQSARNVVSQGSGAASVMNENIQMLQKRGENLSRLDDSVNKMTNEANNFLDLIKEHNKKEAEKKWYQI